MSHFCTLLSPCRVHVAIGKLDVEHWQRLCTYILRELEELEESQSVALIVVGIVAIVKRVLPAVLVERTVLHRTDGVLPLVAGLKVSTLHDTSSGEAEQTGLHVGKSLGHIAAQSVLAVLECVHGEEAHVLKAHGIAALEEDAQVSLLVGDGSFHDNLILLPVGRSDVESLLHELLVLAP